MQFNDRKILLTGGNSGIGEALAEALQAIGNRLVITGRNPASLKQTLERNPSMAGYVLDVTDTDASTAFAKQVLADHPDLDAVILNAGIMEAEDYTADPVTVDTAERIIATNLLAPIRLAAALLPHLQTRNEAALVTVSSGLAFVPKAGNPTYSATKAAIHSWTQSLRHQLATTSVSVHEIAPPMVATELTPGQSKQERAMPLDDFVNEVVEIMRRPVVPGEILVERVRFFRNAEAESRFDAAFKSING